MTDTISPILPRIAFVGRQAIFDREMEVFGYELLYRDGMGDDAQFADGDEATAQVMVNTFLEFGIDHIVGNGQAFVNFTGNFFLNHTYEVLPPDAVVLEVLESIEPTPAMLQALGHAREKGYKIALDDFVMKDSHRALVELADFVKVDILACSPDDIQGQLQQLQSYPVRILAEKIEDQEMFERCLKLGCEFFQGYFFCKPQIMEGKSLSSNRMAIILLLAKLQDPQIDLRELDELVKSDLALSRQLLQYVNSASVGLPRTVDSISQAVCLVGTERMRHWASLLVLANMGWKPSELMRVALIRAHMCELVSEAQGGSAEQGFTVGLFSVLDAYFDCPMDQLLKDLPLAPEIQAALLEREGLLGKILTNVIWFEHGAWDSGPKPNKLEAYNLREAYWRGVEWANGLMQSLGK